MVISSGVLRNPTQPRLNFVNSKFCKFFLRMGNKSRIVVLKSTKGSLDRDSGQIKDRKPGIDNGFKNCYVLISFQITTNCYPPTQQPLNQAVGFPMLETSGAPTRAKFSNPATP